MANHLLDNPSPGTLRARKWARRNPKKVSAINKTKHAKRQLDPANRKAAVDRASKWQIEHKEHRRSYLAARYQAKKDILTAQNAEWKKDHPEEWKRISLAGTHRYQARKRGATIGEVDFDAVVAKANGLCGICGNPIDGAFQYDHIRPISRGGEHSTGNLQIAHGPCNRKKSASLEYIPC